MTWKTRQRERKADMPEVYIDSLTLENFGPFYGEHTLNFDSLGGRCGESGVRDWKRVAALAVVA